MNKSVCGELVTQAAPTAIVYTTLMSCVSRKDGRMLSRQRRVESGELESGEGLAGQRMWRLPQSSSVPGPWFPSRDHYVAAPPRGLTGEAWPSPPIGKRA